MGLTKVELKGLDDGTDGQIITYDASGNPVAVGPGTDGQVLTSTGAGSPPAFEDIPAKAALTGSTNNTICTVTSANNIQGEANLTYDGSHLSIATDGSAEGLKITSTGNTYNEISFDADRTSAGTHLGRIVANWDGTAVSYISMDAGDDTTNKDDGIIRFWTAADGNGNYERLRIDSSGRVGIGSDSPVASTALFGGTQNCLKVAGSAAPQVRIVSDTANQADLILQAGNSGADAYIANAGSNGDIVFSTHNGTSQGTRLRILDDGGICFNSDTAAANALNDYEEGTFTITDASGQSLSITNEHTGRYVKIGQFVYLQVDISYPSTSSTTTARINVPFQSGIQEYGGGQAGWTDLDRPAFGHINSDGCWLMDNNSSGSGKHLDNDQCSGKRFIMQLTYKTTA